MVDSTTLVSFENKLVKVLTLLELSGKSPRASKKSDGTFVTDFDIQIEKMLTRLCETALPGSVICAEEMQSDYPSDIKQYEYFWIIDPIDGTTNFINGNGKFYTCLTLFSYSAPVKSWVYCHTTRTLSTTSDKTVNSSGLFNETSVTGIVCPSHWPVETERKLSEFSAPGIQLSMDWGCGTEQYVELIFGQSHHFLLVWEMYPWDHLPQLHLALSNGLYVGYLDGKRFMLDGTLRKGVLVAKNTKIAESVKHKMVDVLTGRGGIHA